MAEKWDFCSCPSQQVLCARQGPRGLLGGNSGSDVSSGGTWAPDLSQRCQAHERML